MKIITILFMISLLYGCYRGFECFCRTIEIIYKYDSNWLLEFTIPVISFVVTTIFCTITSPYWLVKWLHKKKKKKVIIT